VVQKVAQEYLAEMMLMRRAANLYCQPLQTQAFDIKRGTQG